MADKGPVLVPMAVCEACWITDHSHWQPESIDENGSVNMRLTGVDLPDSVSLGSVDVCALCGGVTISGIYELKDPNDAHFTASDSPPEFELGLQEYGDDFL